MKLHKILTRESLAMLLIIGVLAGTLAALLLCSPGCASGRTTLLVGQAVVESYLEISIPDLRDEELLELIELTEDILTISENISLSAFAVHQDATREKVRRGLE